MEVIEDSEGESGIRPVHRGRKELGPSKLNSIRYILAATIFDGNMVDSISVNDHTVTPGSRETVPTLFAMMTQTKHSAKGKQRCGLEVHTTPVPDMMKGMLDVGGDDTRLAEHLGLKTFFALVGCCCSAT